MKRLKKVDKGYKPEKEEPEVVSKPKVSEYDCPECSKGFLQEINIAGRIFQKCDICYYRTKVITGVKK